jgi:hypothetical protein
LVILRALDSEFVISELSVFINTRKVFKDMKKGGVSIDLVPTIVRISEVKGKIVSRNRGQEISLLRS